MEFVHRRSRRDLRRRVAISDFLAKRTCERRVLVHRGARGAEGPIRLRVVDADDAARVVRVVASAEVQIELGILGGCIRRSELRIEHCGRRVPRVRGVVRGDVEVEHVEPYARRHAQTVPDVQLRHSVRVYRSFDDVIVAEGAVRVANTVVRQEETVLGDVVVPQACSERRLGSMPIEAAREIEPGDEPIVELFALIAAREGVDGLCDAVNGCSRGSSIVRWAVRQIVRGMVSRGVRVARHKCRIAGHRVCGLVIVVARIEVVVGKVGEEIEERVGSVHVVLRETIWVHVRELGRERVTIGVAAVARVDVPEPADHPVVL